jgi:uncharacterized coiled-coil protein SlyX
MGITTEEALSILDDPMLAKEFISDLKDGKLNAQGLLNYLEQTKQLKKIDVQVSLLTDDQKFEKVGDAFSKINEWFAAQEAAIDAKYQAEIKGQEDKIAAGEKLIKGLNDKIYENEYQLESIQAQEDTINEKYDARTKALDKILQTNKLIQAQEKGALTIADALSQGDIAAAARAVQQNRMEVAAANAEDMKARLEKAKETELAAIRSADGRSRIEIEKQIKDYKRQISEIEHDTIKPAEKVRDAAIAKRDAEKAALDYLGLSKTAWGDVETATNKARVEAEGYKKAIEDALALLPGLGVTLPSSYTGSGGGSGGGGDDAKAKRIAELNQQIQTNRDSVNGKDGMSAAEKKATSENIKLIKELRELTGDSTTKGGTKAMGGIIKRFASGGWAMGSDIVPSLLTPGEFVVKRPAVRSFGVDRLRAINNGTYNGESVYNYDINVNVQTDANPDQIASAVMAKIKSVESQRIRGGRF